MRFLFAKIFVLFIVLTSFISTDNKVSVIKFEALEPYLSMSNDSVYVINFWATWCAPCVEELPYFNEAASDFKNEKVKILLVSLDFPNQLESRLLPYVEENNIIPQVMLLNEPNANKWIDKVDPSWSGAIPATLIYKNDQRSFHEGTFDKVELYNLIKSYLK